MYKFPTKSASPVFSIRGTFAFDRLREAITATLETLAAGKITPKELPIATGERQRTDKIRVAPGFGFGQNSASATLLPSGAYTVDSIAKFLGEVDEAEHASHDFKATFGALELIDGNGLKEGDIAGLEVWKIDAVVSLRTLHNGAGRHRPAIVS